ncbi:MAG: sialate O-acetylesterase [Terracidiphilus sp.]|jgi:sialate O-acetylesterase
MKLRTRFSISFFLGFVFCWAANAQITLPKILTSHMVVQRDAPVHVWGLAAPNEQVSVTFRGETGAATAGELGRWSVYLKPGAAGGPFTLTVQGTETGGQPQTITLDDVLVGDVWVASGQSNMGFVLHDAATAAEDLPKAGIQDLRLLNVKQTASLFPQDDLPVVGDGWAISSPETAEYFSAVAWYFAREIEQREHVPVGIINSSWGGTPVDAWTRIGAIGQDASLMPLFISWGKMIEDQPDALLRAKIRQRAIDDAKAQGKPVPNSPWTPDLASWGPGMLWNGMIAPLTPAAIRGAIWYQGESNASPERAPIYGRIFEDMIEDWRNQWGVGEFPFLYVQIANWNAGPGDGWPQLREQQRKTLELHNTGMAVTIDIGNPANIHPTDKLDVGLRLARWARVLTYGEKLEVSGPLFREAVPEGPAIRAYFDHAKGLNAKGGAPTSFEVAGADGKWSAATATIDGDTIVASSPDVAKPTQVRYGWASSPQCNLFNSDELPASPFTSAQ